LSILAGSINEAEALNASPPPSWYQNYTHLSPHAAFFLWHGLASSTRSTYRTGQKSFYDFVTLYPQFRNADGSILPAALTSMIEWVAWLGGTKQLQPSMIKAYVAHLHSAHVDADLPFIACESPMLQRIIRGIKRYMGEREHQPKMPITSMVLK